MTTEPDPGQKPSASVDAAKRRARSRRIVIGLFALMVLSGVVASRPILPRRVVAFGDSYFSGYGMEPSESFPAQLEQALRRHGYNARVVNAGVPGETIADGLARLDETLAQKPDLIILELGANDGELALDPDVSRANLDRVLAKIRAAHVRVLLCGALAPAEFGEDYRAQFDPIFPDMAAKHRVPLYPFILDGVASDDSLIQDDGEHPNPKGVQVMVDRILPQVERAFR